MVNYGSSPLSAIKVYHICTSGLELTLQSDFCDLYSSHPNPQAYPEGASKEKRRAGIAQGLGERVLVASSKIIVLLVVDQASFPR